jgi:DNA polymerase-1
MTSASTLKKGDHLYLVDGSGYIFRAYHALPPLTRKSDGLPVGAVQGFCNMLWKLLKEMRAGEKPTHLAVIFDHSSKTFRNDFYPEYKANREEPPADLRPQFGLIRQATRAFNVACIEQENYEADDLIATYARMAEEAGATCRIVSSDKDLMQLVRDGITLYDTMKEKDLGEAEVLEKFGVRPNKVIDVQALAGDSVDNVPGVPGIGIKTGAQLITEYGDLETLLKRAPEIKQQKRRENLIEFAEQARISKRLVTLDAHVPVTHDITSFAIEEPKASQLIGFMKALEFSSSTKKVAGELGADMGAIDPIPVEIKFWPPEGGAEAAMEASPRRQAFARSADKAAKDLPPAEGQGLGVQLDALKSLPYDASHYATITELPELEKLVALARDVGHIVIGTRTSNDDDPLRSSLAGIALCVEPGKAAYLPVGHRAKGEGLFGGELMQGQLASADVFNVLKPLLEDASILTIGHEIKRDMEVVSLHGVTVRGIDDVQILSYAFESGLTSQSLPALAERHLGHKLPDIRDLAGGGRSVPKFEQLPIEVAAPFACHITDATLRLWHVLKGKLVEARKVTVYETLERPLIPVLADMELEGILIDPALLKKLSNEFAVISTAHEKEIYKLAGESFNIGSPKQLGDILFGKMGLEGGRKTQTGAWSTDAEVLEQLAGQGVEIARKVLDWRAIFKLIGNYTDALPGYINERTGRVHTSYMMASTSTGRLSSTEPNLQVIPIRTEEGRKIRGAFIAPSGSKLISADYSQIELRVFAHVADIPQLKKAFAEGLDIHAMTASEMFGIPVKGMPSDVRRRAKAINFGIIYGISAFGLANQLQISREEAGNYIKTYFSRFPGIRDYMDAMKKQSHEMGYVETIFGRRCHFPRIKSSNASERSNAERASINAPIQGAAADIIRRAMIRMPKALAEAGLSSKMLLQVHDELLFEAKDGEVEETMKVAKRIMEGAPEPAVKLTVPLQVDARAAQNWDEAH